MTTIKVRGIPRTPAKIDIPGDIVELEPVPSGLTAGSTLVWNGTSWVTTQGDIDYSDPPALVISIFGANRMVAFSQSQILSSHDEQPRYQWNTPVTINQFSVGPDGAIYTGSTSAGITRMPLRGSGSLTRYTICATPAGANMGAIVWFASQAASTGLDAYTLFGKRANPADAVLRFPASAALGSSNPAWNTPDIFPTIGITDTALDSAGNCWIQSSSNNIVRYTNLNGAPGVGVGDVQLTGSNWPANRQGMAVSSIGDLYSARYAGTELARMITAATIAGLVGAGPSNPVPNIITSNELRGAGWPVFDYAGNMWMPSYDNTRILRFAAADLLASGTISPSIVLTGGGTLGNGGSTGPSAMRAWIGTGPLK